MCLLITLFNILINQKAGHLSKRKTNSSAKELTRKLHTSKYTNLCFKIKENFLYYNKGTIDYNQQCHPLHLGNEQCRKFPQKKKKSLKREKDIGKERKRDCEREGKGEERRKRREGRRGENGESGTKGSSLSAPPSSDAFPSTVPSSDGARE